MTPADRVEAVWRARAERLSQRPVSSQAGQNAFPVLVLGIGRERYGIYLSDVAEVLPRMHPTPVPGVAAIFAGVINVHGEIRPVIDLGRYLGIERLDPIESAGRRLILLRRDGREMGLQIDRVEQIRWIAAGDLETAGNSEAGGSRRMEGSTKDLLMLLATEALFAQIQQLETGVRN